jgi:hypothetical protein
MTNQIVKGAYARLSGTVYQDTGAPADLTGATLTVMFKSSESLPDSDALFSLTPAVISPTAGTYQVAIPAASTLNLKYSRVYFEIVVTLADSRVIRTGVEELSLLPNVKKQ